MVWRRRACTMAVVRWAIIARAYSRPPRTTITAAVIRMGTASDSREAPRKTRAMIAHRTTAIVQARLRQTIYDRVVALGPAHFTRARTGDVLVSMVEGVQRSEG